MVADYVFASAFIDVYSIIPVELQIKEFNKKANKLHVAIASKKNRRHAYVNKERKIAAVNAIEDL